MVAYAVRHGEHHLPHGFVRRRMALHQSASARTHGTRTSQASQLKSDPRCRLLRPEERLPLAVATEGLSALEERLDGLITNDKFCFTRRSRLKLRPIRRGYPSRDGVRWGGIDETELDRSTHDGRWDQAYVHLLRWAAPKETTNEEVPDASGDLRPGFDPSPSAGEQHRPAARKA